MAVGRQTHTPPSSLPTTIIDVTDQPTVGFPIALEMEQDVLVVEALRINGSIRSIPTQVDICESSPFLDPFPFCTICAGILSDGRPVKQRTNTTLSLSLPLSPLSPLQRMKREIGCHARPSIPVSRTCNFDHR